MELRIVESNKNAFPLKAILVKCQTVKDCLIEIQRMGYSLGDLQIHPLPGAVPNSLWGYVVLLSDTIVPEKHGRHERVQMVSPNLLIPERSRLFPMPTSHELQRLFPSSTYIAHPEFGWVELSDPVDLKDLIAAPVNNHRVPTRPQPTPFVPHTIRSFQIQSVPPEEVLQNMEDQVFPKHQKFDDRPLNIGEKIRLQFYKAIFSSKKNRDAGSQSTADVPPTWFSKLFQSFDKNNRMQQDFHDLEERNKKNIDKLMDLLKNDPDRALQYAIPLDEQGSTRGGQKTHLDLSKRWFDFSLNFNSQNNPGSGSIDLGNHFHDLQRQYYATAEELTRKQDYQKAAFVYMKLLKNLRKAAETLAGGKLYQEAATIYLKHCNDKMHAAQCYEDGKMTSDAIALYAELNENEKVGDLYMTLNKNEQAKIYYEKVIHSHKGAGKYVKASLIYRNKMNDPLAGQAMLLDGWRTNKDAVNCLNNYFTNIEDQDVVKKELNTIYRTDVDEQRAASFLEVIKHEFRKRNELKGMIKEMAYELVAKNISTNPSIVSELKNFSPANKELFKDTLRFKLSKNFRK